MSRGDHIYVRRVLYAHHGIDMGDGTVVHFAGEADGNKRTAEIRRTPLDEFARGGAVRVRAYAADQVTANETVERATSRLGEARYNLAFNNCEHFASWCATGAQESAQVKGAAASSAVVGGSSVLVGGGLTVVSAVGEVAGVSAAGIMSGLVAIGGGVTTGITLLSLGPAALSVGVMHLALRDRHLDPDGERHARAVGRATSVAGAAGGVALGGWLLSASGTVAGVSAAGITSGLSAIGGTSIGVALGGGMLAGLGILVALPGVLAAVLGYTAYRAARFGASRQASALLALA